MKTRNLKAMGLALLCSFALGAIGAQSASAVVEHSFSSDSANGSTVLTATTESGTKEVFTVTAVSISCEDVVYRATVVGGLVDHVAVFPDFSGANTKCVASALGTATITNDGCTYTFDSDTMENTTHFGAGPLHANVSLVCAHEKAITISAGGCTITVGDTHSPVTVNQNLPGVRFTALANHSGGKAGMTVDGTLKTIKVMTSGANCVLGGLGNPGTHANATYTSKGIITGYEDQGGTGHGPFTEGPLVNLGITTP